MRNLSFLEWEAMLNLSEPFVQTLPLLDSALLSNCGVQGMLSPAGGV
jgi:hypothetical protein